MTTIYRYSGMWMAMSLFAYVLLKWPILLIPTTFFALVTFMWFANVIYTMSLSMKALIDAQLMRDWAALTFEELIVECEKRAKIPMFFPEINLYIATAFLYQLGWIKQSEGMPPRIELT